MEPDEKLKSVYDALYNKCTKCYGDQSAWDRDISNLVSTKYPPLPNELVGWSATPKDMYGLYNCEYCARVDRILTGEMKK